MAAGIHPGDFVGYPIGVPAVEPPVSAPGLVGMLDFSFYPVGRAAVSPPPPTPSPAARRGIAGGLSGPLLPKKKRKKKRKKFDDDEDLLLMI